MAQNDFLHGVEVKNTPATQPAVDVNLSTIGITGIAPFADPQAFPLDTPVLVSGSDTQLIGKLVATAPAGAADVGTLPVHIASILDECSPMMIVVRVAGSTSYDVETVPEIVGGIDASGAYKGVHAFLAAESVTGYRPRLLCAPGYCHLSSNAVLAELKTVADKLRAVVFADGPNTTMQDAIAMAQVGGSRTMLIDPWIVRETNGVQAVIPPSAKFAALQAYSDQQNGFWRSLSNQELHGVLGLSRPVDFVLGDQTCAANVLNANNIATIVRRAGTGYVSWGNRALDGSFLCVTRTLDDINDALLLAVMQFVDRGIDKNFVTEVTSFVNSYLRQLKSKGAITGGKCWADTSLNTASAVTNGQVYFDFDVGPVYPAERITFRSSINDGYVSTIFTGSNS